MKLRECIRGLFSEDKLIKYLCEQEPVVAFRHSICAEVVQFSLVLLIKICRILCIHMYDRLLLLSGVTLKINVLICENHGWMEWMR